MKRLASVILLAASCATLAQQVDEPQKCEGPEGSTHFEACVTIKETSALDAKLNKKYKELLKFASDTSPPTRQALIESQRAWIKYRDKTCNFQQHFLGGISSINAIRCTHALTAERLKYFEGL